MNNNCNQIINRIYLKLDVIIGNLEWCDAKDISDFLSELLVTGRYLYCDYFSQCYVYVEEIENRYCITFVSFL